MTFFHGSIAGTFLHGDGSVPVAATAPSAPTAVVGDATGGGTYLINWGDSSGDELGFRVQIESPAGSGNWVAATGAANPTAAGATSFAGTGASPATPYTPRVQAFNLAGDSAWTVGPEFTTDNTAPGDPVPVPVTSSVAAIESGADSATVLATVAATTGATAAVSIFEAGPDVASILASIFKSHVASVAALEFDADVVAVGAEVSPAIGCTVAVFEEGPDTVAIEGAATAASTSVGGMLAALAAEYASMRAASGLFVGSTEVLMCAIAATRFYAGLAIMADPVASGGPFYVTGSTIVTTDEWAIIAPLFRLYVERESAVVLEASRSMGVDQVGRSFAEVAGDIAQLEAAMPNLAFVEEVWSVGFPN